MRIPVYRGEAPEEVTDDDLEVDDEDLSTPSEPLRDTMPPIEEDADGQVR